MNVALLVKDLRERTGAGMMDCKKAVIASDGDIEKAIEWLRENGITKAAKKGNRIAAEGLTAVVENDTHSLILELNAETDFVAKNQEFLTLLDKISMTLLNSKAETIEEALAVKTGDETVETLIINGTATSGEKISLRRFKRLEKAGTQQIVKYSHMGGRISVIVKLASENTELGKNIAMHIAAEKPEYLSKSEVSEDVIQKERKILLNEALNEGKPENIAEKMVEGRIRKYYEQVCLLEQAFVMDSDHKVADIVSEANNEILEFVRYEIGEGIEKEEVNFADEVAAQLKN